MIQHYYITKTRRTRSTCHHLFFSGVFYNVGIIYSGGSKEMFDERGTRNWWAKGDTPVHNDSRVTYLVDGRAAMLMMCRHFLGAHKYIYLANWGMTPGIELVRGIDYQAGPDGSPE